MWVFQWPQEFPLCPHDISCCEPVETPWNSGDVAEIITTKPFRQGDSWVLDMSRFGQSDNVTQAELEKVDVVPNPYIVRSGLNESKSSRRLMFTKLPNKSLGGFVAV